jgi:hypothetical protein
MEDKDNVNSEASALFRLLSAQDPGPSLFRGLAFFDFHLLANWSPFPFWNKKAQKYFS